MIRWLREVYDELYLRYLMWRYGVPPKIEVVEADGITFILPKGEE